MAAKLSGAARRKLEKQREAEKLGAVTSSPADLAPYIKLGPPPVDEPVGIISWANKVGALMLWEVLTDSTISKSDRRRVVGDMISKIGLTHSKAHNDKILVDIKNKIEATQQASEEFDHELESDYPEDGDRNQPPKGSPRDGK